MKLAKPEESHPQIPRSVWERYQELKRQEEELILASHGQFVPYSTLTCDHPKWKRLGASTVEVTHHWCPSCGALKTEHYSLGKSNPRLRVVSIPTQYKPKEDVLCG